jgi:hypothetical protein
MQIISGCSLVLVQTKYDYMESDVWMLYKPTFYDDKVHGETRYSPSFFLLLFAS